MQPLLPLKVPFRMKSLASAQTEVRQLPDGRVAFSIVHELVRGVTPAMLVWWFNNMEGELDLGFGPAPRYRVWHPVDHVAVTYVRPAIDGRRFGTGAQVHIQERFGAAHEFAIDAVTTIEFLDETGFAHAERRLGVTLGELRYAFESVSGGTVYRNALTVGIPGARLVNRLLLPWLFPEAKGRAWQQHNVEEVGNFEFFLPQLYAAERG